MKLIAATIPLLLIAGPALAQQPQHKPGKFFETADTDKDGSLSAAEWQAAGRRPEGFAMMDSNKDGKVTREEGRAAMMKMREMHGQQQAAPTQ